MERVKLGGSEVEVSAICLGTMTYGNQTLPADAHAQMDRALAAGITFMDCAEMYPVNPVRPETVGRSEEIIGEWIAARRPGAGVQIATKMTGPSPNVRDGRPYDGATVTACIEASLRRLRVDVIDLYQLHWPVRGSYHFRQSWTYDPSGQDRAATLAHMEDVLTALEAARAAGKIRAAGLSNESAWGLTRWIDVAGRIDAPRMAAIQNEYSVLNRAYDTDLAEVAVNEGVTLMSYSPLAAGLLTGKYQDGALPPGSRAAVDKAHGGAGILGGRKTERSVAATGRWLALCHDHGWDPVHLAIAWQLTRPFPVVPIIGATTDAQLAHLLDGFGRVPDADTLAAITRFHRDTAQSY